MAIIETIDESLFISRFEDYKRVDKGDGNGGNFTYEGLRHLFSYLDDLCSDNEKNIELDVIALCCDFSEYKDLNEFLNDRYTTDEINAKKEEYETIEEFEEAIEEEINNNTTLIKFGDSLNDGFIISQY